MNATTPTVNSIETYLDFLKKVAKEGAGNVPVLYKLDKEEYRNALEKIEYWYFVQSADYHYFVSRILFLRHIIEYSQFSGYQSIENYLKAYLKFKGQVPPNSHDLRELLRLCRAEYNDAESFINGDNISIIIEMYEPFYELARYPVQKQNPKSGYGSLIPHDIYILDYFVLKMREILAVPENTWDILKNGHFYLFECQQNYPEIYDVFFVDNINFTDKG